MRSHHKIIEELIEKHAPLFSKAFIASVEQIREDVILSEIVRHLEAGNLEAAIAALGLEPRAYRKLTLAISTGFEEAGERVAATFPKLNTPAGKLVFRFDMTNPQAERYLATHSSTLITRITEDQRSAARTFLSQRMFQGANPRTTALDLVGRISRQTQRRTGGVLGLSSIQEQYVANARAQLLSGDPVQMRQYLERVRRDKRFDRPILKAIDEGRPVDAKTVNRAVGRYNDSLLKLRGDTIGRTESLQSLNRAQFETYRQSLETGGVRKITRIWDTSGRNNVRDTHRAMDEQRRIDLDPFISPSGARFMHPGDTSLGASAKEVINCACRIRTNIDFLAGIK